MVTHLIIYHKDTPSLKIRKGINTLLIKTTRLMLMCMITIDLLWNIITDPRYKVRLTPIGPSWGIVEVYATSPVSIVVHTNMNHRIIKTMPTHRQVIIMQDNHQHMINTTDRGKAYHRHHIDRLLKERKGALRQRFAHITKSNNKYNRHQPDKHIITTIHTRCRTLTFNPTVMLLTMYYLLWIIKTQDVTCHHLLTISICLNNQDTCLDHHLVGQMHKKISSE